MRMRLVHLRCEVRQLSPLCECDERSGHTPKNLFVIWTNDLMYHVTAAAVQHNAHALRTHVRCYSC